VPFQSGRYAEVFSAGDPLSGELFVPLTLNCAITSLYG
jgi:hypothetical protein